MTYMLLLNCALKLVEEIILMKLHVSAFNGHLQVSTIFKIRIPPISTPARGFFSVYNFFSMFTNGSCTRNRMVRELI